MNFSINITGSWKAITPFVNIGGTWKSFTGAFVNIGGTWAQFWSNVTVSIQVNNTNPPAGYTYGASLTAIVSNGTASAYSWSIISGSGTIVSGQGTNTAVFGYNNGANQPTVQVVVTVNGSQYTSSPQFL